MDKFCLKSYQDEMLKPTLDTLMRVVNYFLDNQKGNEMLESVIESLLSVQSSVSAVDVKLDEIKAKLASFAVEGESVVKIEKAEYDALLVLVESLKSSALAVAEEAAQV